MKLEKQFSIKSVKIVAEEDQILVKNYNGKCMSVD